MSWYALQQFHLRCLGGRQSCIVLRRLRAKCAFSTRATLCASFASAQCNATPENLMAGRLPHMGAPVLHRMVCHRCKPLGTTFQNGNSVVAVNLSWIFNIGLASLLLCSSVHAQLAPTDVMKLMRTLAAGRLTLDRCVAHPDYNKEAMNASGLFLQTQSVSSRLDRLVNDIHFTAPDRMPYMGYSNVLKQLKAIENSNRQEVSKRKSESIESACEAARIDAVKAKLAVLEKQIQPLLLAR